MDISAARYWTTIGSCCIGMLLIFFFFFAFHIHLIINEKAPRGKGWVLRCIKYSMERIVVLSSLYEEIKMGWRFGKIKDLFFR